MSFSTVKHFSHPKHPLLLKEDDVIGVDATCSVCNKPVIGSPSYTCSSDDIGCRKFYLHKSCAENLTLEHFIHPKHPLILDKDVVIGVDAKCYVCDKQVIGSPTYTCISIKCKHFYLHKICAELPQLISHHKHDIHPLALLPHLEDKYCDVCGHEPLKVTYACDDCDFDVCVVCAFEQRVLHHPGHSEHSLTLMKREALFKCDACGEEARDSSYSCNPCEFWIHKTCAISPLIIPDPTYHHHPLELIYSIPEMHRYFKRFCNICSKRLPVSKWMYYCHRCTYFVHMKCATSLDTLSITNEIEENGTVDEPDLLQFPLPGEESFFDLIITRCSKYQVKFQADSENSTTMLKDPHIIKGHWSHRDHSLEMQQFTFSENELHDDDNDNYDDSRVLLCDGCIQPITFSHVSYYACIQCRFFLHTFCATKLPAQLPLGACSFHPHHLLKLAQYPRFYDFFGCAVCGYVSNGFYYKCEICDIRIEIRCAFLPTRIRHKSHKKHSLVQRPFSGSQCSTTTYTISRGVEYACETCSTFQIHIVNAFYPSRVKHKYDDHTISLKHPPFFYEGVFYCEICEDQVNNQWWLYHCDKCDHSFHYQCIRSNANIKIGGTIKHSIANQQHTLTLVLKMTTRKNSSPYLCVICGKGYEYQFFFECEGCGYLACIFCIRRKYRE